MGAAEVIGRLVCAVGVLALPGLVLVFCLIPVWLRLESSQEAEPEIKLEL